MTSLIAAAQNGYILVVRVLLNHNANLNQTDKVLSYEYVPYSSSCESLQKHRR